MPIRYFFFFKKKQVSGLNSGRGLKITIYAANANGRSPNIELEGFTLKVAELQVGKPYFFVAKTSNVEWKERF